MPLDIQDDIKTRMGLEVLQGYGLTECFIVAWNRHEYNKKATLGLPFASDIEFSIVGDDGMHKEVNEIGEIVIKTPAVMREYYNQENETREVLKNGWFYTGDYGYLDSERYLHFTGLKKNVAKVSGNMVDLKEVQNVLLSHPLISDAIVYSEEDALWGHVVAAEVVSRINGELTENEVRSFCAKKLSRYKIPKTIKFTAEVA